MGQEITVYQALANVGQLVATMAQSIKTRKTFRKQDAIVLQEQLRYVKSACRMKGYGELTRLAVDEIERTLQRINQKGFSGETLDMCMDLLSLQYQSLYQAIQDYKST